MLESGDNLVGLQSCGIDDEHRMVYDAQPSEITIISCGTATNELAAWDEHGLMGATV